MTSRSFPRWALPLAAAALILLLLMAGRAAAAPAPQVAPSPTATPGAGWVPLTPSPAATRAPVTPVPAATRRPYTGRPNGTPVPIVYVDPANTSLDGLWIGQLTRAANIRVGPGTGYAINRAWPAGRRVLVYAAATAANGEIWYQVGHYPDPTLYVHSSLVTPIAPVQVPAAGMPGRWIDVNLTQQVLIAFENMQPVLVAQTASGRTGHETLIGLWHIYWRLPLQDMQGGDDTPGNKYYNLKDVPWVQYFQETGQSLHGTYWHDNFGTPMSHGCVNLSDQNAEWLYDWAGYGTPVNVHN